MRRSTRITQLAGAAALIAFTASAGEFAKYTKIIKTANIKLDV